MELATLPLLADIADLADRRGVEPDDEDYQALQALSSASAFFRSYTGKVITVVEDDEQILTGVWDKLLKLPQPPVLSVSSVSRRFGTESIETLESDFAYSVLRNHLYRYGGWGGPDSIVTVTYSHGFDPIPDDVRHCVLSMASRNYAAAASEASGASGPIVREEIGSYAIQYGEASASSTSDTVSTVGVTSDEQFVLDKYAQW